MKNLITLLLASTAVAALGMTRQGDLGNSNLNPTVFPERTYTTACGSISFDKIALLPSRFQKADKSRDTFSMPMEMPKAKKETSLHERMRAMAKADSSEKVIKLDSVTAVNLNGTPTLKQTFTYDNAWRPLVGRELYYNSYANSYNLSTEVEYAYDEQGRIIVSSFYYGEGREYEAARKEFFYTDDTDWYSSEILYIMFDPYTYEVTDDWVPYQKGEYTYNSYGDCTNQLFYLWNEEEGTWDVRLKYEATFDADGRVLSIFAYAFENGQWTGNFMTETGYNEGNTYTFTADGNPATVGYWTWEGNEWLEYRKLAWTYNEKGNLLKYEDLFWNRGAQDWSGNDTWYDYKYDSRETNYSYDEEGRVTLAKTLSLNGNGEWIYIGQNEYEYEALPDGFLRKIDTCYMRWLSPIPSPYSRVLQEFNTFGTETRYLGYGFTSEGEAFPKEETLRFFGPDNEFLKGEYYGFRNDEEHLRYAESMEEYFYDAQHNDGKKPYMGVHYSGIDGMSEDWVPKYRLLYTWSPAPMYLLQGIEMENWIDEDWVAYSSYLNEYDFATDINTVVLWPNVLPNDAYLYQIVSAYTWLNTDGDDSWDATLSQNFDYHYSKITNAAVKSLVSNPNKVEVARYDLMGRRLAEPTEGVNIIRYSDGTSEKVMVKF